MKEQQGKQDFMAWMKALIPDTPEMQAIAQEESERIELAFALKKAREAAGHNQKSLAEQMGVSQAMISKWENVDHNHTLHTLQKLMEVLGAKLVMGLEVNGEFIPVTAAARRAVVVPEPLYHQIKEDATCMGVQPRDVILGRLQRDAHLHLPQIQQPTEVKGHFSKAVQLQLRPQYQDRTSHQMAK
ncbi:helix-turn-helix domain-containing protein [Deinococcus roseus]|uniref:HTH cro/C1-type domain-containing protein n=1 Tax=Deinococcus roseus TaxID=392414 RepID=A0ABQ2D2E6_9DEIO|nr:helix-turn-helix transcriptional regulator [Deinococcus roseus]GGJ43166.1 hypothetical protein GCM10008938_31770 [Deinococcus roseus]